MSSFWPISSNPISTAGDAGPSHVVMDAEVGSFALSGQDAGLEKSLTLPIDPAAFSLNGQEISLAREAVIISLLGTFTVTGQAAGTKVGRAVTASSGAFALTGSSIDLSHQFNMLNSKYILLGGVLDSEIELDAVYEGTTIRLEGRLDEELL